MLAHKSTQYNLVFVFIQNNYRQASNVGWMRRVVSWNMGGRRGTLSCGLSMTRWKTTPMLVTPLLTPIIWQVEKAYTQLREFILPTIAKLGGEGGSGEKFI